MRFHAVSMSLSRAEITARRLASRSELQRSRIAFPVTQSQPYDHSYFNFALASRDNKIFNVSKEYLM